MKTRIAEIIREHRSFEIITHESPDEDAVGSSKALAFAIVSMGKYVCLVYPTPVPETLSFTDSPEENLIDTPEISILVDVSDMLMLKKVKPRGKVVVIDHHRAKGDIGYASWIDSKRSSTCEMIYELLAELKAALTPSIASNLYLGLFGDTGGFIHANTNAYIFQIAHELTNAGADPHNIAYRLKKTKALSFYRILCAVMDRMIMQEGLFASYISFEEMKKYGARPEDASGIVEEMASLSGSNLVILLKELQKGTVHCSIRSKIPDAALKTASAFGGGGHGLAAGFTAEGTPEELIHRVIKEGFKWI